MAILIAAIMRAVSCPQRAVERVAIVALASYVDCAGRRMDHHAVPASYAKRHQMEYGSVIIIVDPDVRGELVPPPTNHYLTALFRLL